MSIRKFTNQGLRLQPRMLLPLLLLALGASNASAVVAPVCTSPALISPADGATNVPLTNTLIWSGSLGGSYDVFFGPGTTAAQLPSTPAGKVTVPLVTIAPLLSGQASWPTPALASGTSYVWKVVPTGCLISTTFIPVATFTTVAAPVVTPLCPTAGPLLTSPVGGVSVPAGSVILTWQPVAGATSYNEIGRAHV